MRKVLLKPAAIPLKLADGSEAKVLHFQPGDAISLKVQLPGLEAEKPYPVLSYTHTADGTHVCLPGITPKAYRVHPEYPAGESREYFLKKLPATVTELCLPQVAGEITFHPVSFQPVMRVSYSNRDRELAPIVQSQYNAAA